MAYRLLGIRRDVLFPAHTVRRAPPLNADDPGSRLSFMRREDTIAECSLCHVKRALVSPFGIVMKGGLVLTESLSPFRQGQREAPTFYRKMLLGRVTPVGGRCVAAHNGFYANYYHWTVEAIPRLFSIRERLAGAKLLLGQDVQPFHRATASLFQMAGIVPIGHDELALAEDLLVPSHTASFQQNNAEVVTGMGAYFRARVPDDRREFRDFHSVYLRRGGSQKRRLVNEEEVIGILTGGGFKVVELEGMDVPAQVNLFRHVRNLAAVHGAGLSNMIYMEPGGLVLSLINEHHPDSAFHHLACALRHRSVVLQCATAGPLDRDVKYLDMKADPAAVRSCLDRFMAR
jgi:capsular polysaccharide biosynthesis protein